MEVTSDHECFMFYGIGYIAIEDYCFTKLGWLFLRTSWKVSRLSYVKGLSREISTDVRKRTNRVISGIKICYSLTGVEVSRVGTNSMLLEISVILWPA